MVITALVTIFVDMENVGGQFIRSVADFGATQGRVCHLAVYGDWRRGYGQHWDTTLDVGGVPRQILRTGGKNSADIAIVVDVMEFLSLSPDVQVYVLATGDSDFVPLAHKLRQRGKVVIGVAPAGRSVADTLVAACDRFERLAPDRSAKPEPIPQVAEGPAPSIAVEKAAPEDLEPTKPLRPPTIEQVRALLTEMLRQRGPMTTGAIGNLLQQAMPGFRHRALGHRTLSDLLRAQADLLDVVPTAHELRVALLPGAGPPMGEDATPYAPDAATAAQPAIAEPEGEFESFFSDLPEPPAAQEPQADPPGPAAEVLWPVLLRHLGGVDLTSHPAARQELALAALLALPSDGRAEATRQRAMDAGIPLPARRAGWLADCADALQELGGESAVLDRLEQMEYPAQKSLLLALPGVGPATAEGVLAALHPLVDQAGPQNLLLF
jgi:hypothetical protein